LANKDNRTKCLQCESFVTEHVDEICRRCWINYPTLARAAIEVNKRFNAKLKAANLAVHAENVLSKYDEYGDRIPTQNGEYPEEKDTVSIPKYTYLGIGLILVVLGIILFAISKF